MLKSTRSTLARTNAPNAHHAATQEVTPPGEVARARHRYTFGSHNHSRTRPPDNLGEGGSADSTASGRDCLWLPPSHRSADTAAAAAAAAVEQEIAAIEEEIAAAEARKARNEVSGSAELGLYVPTVRRMIHDMHRATTCQPYHTTVHT